MSTQTSFVLYETNQPVRQVFYRLFTKPGEWQQWALALLMAIRAGGICAKNSYFVFHAIKL